MSQAIVFVLLFVSAAQCYNLECYLSTQERVTGYDIAECPSDAYNSYCMKTITEIGGIGGYNSYSFDRRCVSGQLSNYEARCVTTGATTICKCNSNLCNGATSANINNARNVAFGVVVAGVLKLVVA